MYEVRRQPGGLWAPVDTATGAVGQLYSYKREATRRVREDNAAAAAAASYRQHYRVQPPISDATLAMLDAETYCECDCPASLAAPGLIAEIRRLRANLTASEPAAPEEA
jgi:hypothetical protein